MTSNVRISSCLILLISCGVAVVPVPISADTVTSPEQVFGLGWISSVAFSPDGQQFLLGGSLVCLRRTDTGATIRFLFDGDTPARSPVAFSPDGTRILTGAPENAVKIWDAATGAAIRTFSGHAGGVGCVAFSRDSTRVLTGSGDSTVKLWDAATGELIRTFTGHTGSVKSVAFSPDGAKIFTGASDGTAKLWELETGTVLWTYIPQGITPSFVCTAMSADGTRVATGTLRGDISVLDTFSGRVLLSFDGGIPLSLAFSPDGTEILASEYGPSSVLWNAVTGALIQSYPTRYVGIASAFSPDGTKVLVGQGPFSHQIFGNGAMLFDTATGGVFHDFTGPDGGLYYPASVAFAPDGTEVAIGSYLWNATTSEVLRTFFPGTGHATSLAFNPSGAGLLMGVSDSTAQVWDVATGTLVQTFSGHTGAVSSVAYSPDGTRVLTGSSDNSARTWNAATGELVQTFSGHTGAVNAVAFSRDGTKVATGSSDLTARLWDAETGAVAQTFSGHTDEVTSVAISPDGTKILTGSADHTAKLWNSATGALLRTLSGHTDDVRSVAFSPGGTQVLTGSFDGTARLWSVALGAELRIFNGQAYGMANVAFSPDGMRILAAGGQTGTLWPGLGDPPFFAKTPRGGWYEEGTALTLEVEVATPLPSTSYQWFKDGVALAEATSDTYGIPSVVLQDSGVYVCRVTDDVKSIHETPPAMITVFPVGSLPATGPIAICIMTGLCLAGALRAFRMAQKSLR